MKRRMLQRRRIKPGVKGKRTLSARKLRRNLRKNGKKRRKQRSRGRKKRKQKLYYAV
jgi:hypothetical protein